MNGETNMKEQQVSFVVYFKGNHTDAEALEKAFRHETLKIIPDAKVNVFKKEHKLNKFNGEKT